LPELRKSSAVRGRDRDDLIDPGTRTLEQLLECRLCDLRIGIPGTALEARVARLYRELEARNILLHPHVWLSEEFFTPDRVPGFAIPFYLAHPRLVRLEHQQMLEAEGACHPECHRILRHEAGHALDEAFQLWEWPGITEVFGSPDVPYPDEYRPDTNSRAFVLNLNAWYAQAHPVEDLAETFAVWLAPEIDWRTQYAGWPALRKLEFVDQLMREIAGKRPRVMNRREMEPVAKATTTLRQHYRRKRAHYAVDDPGNYDDELRRIFAPAEAARGAPSAVVLVRDLRHQLRAIVAEGTGVHAYVVEQLIRHVIARCRALRLRAPPPHDITQQRLTVLLTVQTLSAVQTGWRVPL
jgi:hypothetical protein